MIILISFSILLFDKKNQKGCSNIKIDNNKVYIHVYLSSNQKNQKYDFYIFIGKMGEKGIQKGYIKTDNFGRFNNTLVIEKDKLCCDINFFKDISLILLRSEGELKSEIFGFRNEKYDYDKVLEEKNKCSKEYETNKDYDKIIENNPEYWPFSEKIDGMKMVKINSKIFENMKLTCLKDCLIEYAKNSLKFYDFLVFGRCSRGDKTVYILGIPDKYNECQVISMANMGARKFYPIDMKTSPQNGSLGFWILFL